MLSVSVSGALLPPRNSLRNLVDLPPLTLLVSSASDGVSRLRRPGIGVSSGVGGRLLIEPSDGGVFVFTRDMGDTPLELFDSPGVFPLSSLIFSLVMVRELITLASSSLQGRKKGQSTNYSTFSVRGKDDYCG